MNEAHRQQAGQGLAGAHHERLPAAPGSASSVVLTHTVALPFCMKPPPPPWAGSIGWAHCTTEETDIREN